MESVKNSFFKEEIKDFYPYLWEDMETLIKPLLDTRYKVTYDKKNDIFFIYKGGKEVIRYDRYDMILYTDIPKADIFMDVQYNKKLDKLKKHFK
ncbi:hypothetical protein [Tenacibaculum phage PTm5]|nr:hypothetical protein [Tenacibaculum phage PTm5]